MSFTIKRSSPSGYYNRQLVTDGTSELEAGEWLGAMKRGVGVGGRCLHSEFHCLANNRHPYREPDEAKLRPHDTDVGYYEIVFSLPLSVSLLSAFDDRLKHRVDKVVREYFPTLEQCAREHDNPDELSGCEPALLAAHFRHWTNVDGEPQVHRHLVVMNLVKTDRGYRALDCRELMRTQALHGVAMLHAISIELRTCGYEVQRDRSGYAFEVVGTPPEAVAAFGNRRREVVKAQNAFRRSGTPLRAASNAAAVATRRGKKKDGNQDPWPRIVATLSDAVRAKIEALVTHAKQVTRSIAELEPAPMDTVAKAIRSYFEKSWIADDVALLCAVYRRNWGRPVRADLHAELARITACLQNVGPKAWSWLSDFVALRELAPIAAKTYTASEGNALVAASAARTAGQLVWEFDARHYMVAEPPTSGFKRDCIALVHVADPVWTAPAQIIRALLKARTHSPKVLIVWHGTDHRLCETAIGEYERIGRPIALAAPAEEGRLWRLDYRASTIDVIEASAEGNAAARCVAASIAGGSFCQARAAGFQLDGLVKLIRDRLWHLGLLEGPEQEVPALIPRPREVLSTLTNSGARTLRFVVPQTTPDFEKGQQLELRDIAADGKEFLYASRPELGFRPVSEIAGFEIYEQVRLKLAVGDFVIPTRYVRKKATKRIKELRPYRVVEISERGIRLETGAILAKDYHFLEYAYAVSIERAPKRRLACLQLIMPLPELASVRRCIDDALAWRAPQRGKVVLMVPDRKLAEQAFGKTLEPLFIATPHSFVAVDPSQFVPSLEIGPAPDGLPVAKRERQVRPGGSFPSPDSPALPRPTDSAKNPNALKRAERAKERKSAEPIPTHRPDRDLRF